jgi:hypothetical protein
MSQLPELVPAGSAARLVRDCWVQNGDSDTARFEHDWFSLDYCGLPMRLKATHNGFTDPRVYFAGCILQACEDTLQQALAGRADYELHGICFRVHRT